MRKQFLGLAVAMFVLAACTNNNSSTIGEQDEEYGKTFLKDSTSAKAETGNTQVDNH